MGKFDVGDHVEVIVECRSYYKLGARGKIIMQDDTAVPNFVGFYSGDYDTCGGAWWAKDEDLKLIQSEPPELAEAREIIAAQQIVIDQLREQLEKRG